MDSTLLYKSNQKTASIPSCALNESDLKSFLEILNGINQEAAEIAASKLIKDPNQSYEEFNKLKESVPNLYKISIQIFGAKGEYMVSQSAEVFSDKYLPDRITIILFDNVLHHKLTTNLEPQLKIEIRFDCSKPSIFDLTTNLSTSTPNNSSIQVLGINETWVEGAYGKVMSFLNERKTNRAWIYQKNVYEFFSWFLMLPASFWILYRINLVFSPYLSNFPTVFQIALYLYFFGTTSLIFRMLFNYSRWVFPYLEITTSSSLTKGATKHRFVLGSLLLAVIGSLLYDIIKFVL